MAQGAASLAAGTRIDPRVPFFTVDLNQSGICQKDLGPQTAAIASTANVFDPDISWAKVEVVD